MRGGMEGGGRGAGGAGGVGSASGSGSGHHPGGSSLPIAIATMPATTSIDDSRIR